MTLLSDYMPLPDGESQYPQEFIEANLALKLKEDEQSVVVGLCDDHNRALKLKLKNFHKKDTVFFKVSKSELTSYLGSQQESFTKGENQESDEKLQLDQLANDAPIINLVNSLINDAIRMGASDIHIESFQSTLLIRYRIDGMLKTVRELNMGLFPGISSRIKVMSSLNIMEKRLPQDGRATVYIDASEVDLRVSIIPTVGGESIVLRLFNKKDAPLELTELGFSNDKVEDFRKAGRISNGILLVTGPTGSGKTTTMNALLREIKDEKLKIITIEDPVEYVIPGIDQIQTNEAIGLNFQSVLKRILRQDPDIIMIGEIRDKETMELALRAALTGHLVLATLHTRDSVSVISRLKDMGAEPYLLAAVLRFSMAQRLVRKLCPLCSEKKEAPPHWEELIRNEGYTDFTDYRGKGCSACQNRGYKGRVAISESFFCDREMESLIIHSHREEDHIRFNKILQKQGFRSLIQDGLDKVHQGLSSLEEIERVVMDI